MISLSGTVLVYNFVQKRLTIDRDTLAANYSRVFRDSTFGIVRIKRIYFVNAFRVDMV